MCDSRSLGMGDIDICRGMVMNMNLGSHNLIFTIQNNAWKNVAKFGYFKLFLGSDKGLGAPDFISGPLRKGEIELCKGRVIGVNRGCRNIILTNQNHA